MIAHAQNVNVPRVENVRHTIHDQEVSAFRREGGFSTVDWRQVASLHQKLHCSFRVRVVGSWGRANYVIQAAPVVHEYLYSVQADGAWITQRVDSSSALQRLQVVF